jgi:hypothetical protein
MDYELANNMFDPTITYMEAASGESSTLEEQITCALTANSRVRVSKLCDSLWHTVSTKIGGRVCNSKQIECALCA